MKNGGGHLIGHIRLAIYHVTAIISWTHTMYHICYFLLQGHFANGGWLLNNSGGPFQPVSTPLCRLSPTWQDYHVAGKVATVPADVCLRSRQADQHVSYLVGTHRYGIHKQTTIKSKPTNRWHFNCYKLVVLCILSDISIL